MPSARTHRKLFNNTASPSSIATQANIFCALEPPSTDAHCNADSYLSTDQLSGIALHMLGADQGETPDSTIPRTIF